MVKCLAISYKNVTAARNLFWFGLLFDLNCFPEFRQSSNIRRVEQCSYADKGAMKNTCASRDIKRMHVQTSEDDKKSEGQTLLNKNPPKDLVWHKL